MWRRGLLRRDVELSTIPSQHQSEDRLINSPSEESHSFRKDAPVQQHQQPLDGERFQGWRFTVFLAFIASLVVLLLNLGFLLYTVAHHRQKDQKGVLYQGDCVKVQHMSTGFHLLVNVLSTALLAASNFGMVYTHRIHRRNRADTSSNVYVPRRGRTLIERISKANGSTSACPVSATYSGCRHGARFYGCVWHLPHFPFI